MQYDEKLGDQQNQGFKGLAGENAIPIFLLVAAAVGLSCVSNVLRLRGVYGSSLQKQYVLWTNPVFIINQNLQFPDGLAAAEIIKSMYKKG